jgi:hypothetical protein
VSYFIMRAGINRAIAQSVGVRQAIDRTGKRKEELAAGFTPVATGRARNSIRRDTYLGHEGWASDVGSDDPDVDYFSYLELGTSDTPTFAPLRKALEAESFTDAQIEDAFSKLEGGYEAERISEREREG